MACMDYEDEDSTDFIRTTETIAYYAAAVKDAHKWFVEQPEHQCHGKRGKKGKSNKDWDK
jgi:hypothetical protein